MLLIEVLSSVKSKNFRIWKRNFEFFQMPKFPELRRCVLDFVNRGSHVKMAVKDRHSVEWQQPAEQATNLKAGGTNLMRDNEFA